jgi:hypothetical protein
MNACNIASSDFAAAQLRRDKGPLVLPRLRLARTQLALPGLRLARTKQPRPRSGGAAKFGPSGPGKKRQGGGCTP